MLQFFFCLILLLTSTLTVNAQEMDTTVEVRAAATFPSSHELKHMYGHVYTSYGVEAATSIWGCWAGWVNADWFSKHGRSKGSLSPHLNMITVSCGLKSNYRICDNARIYLGAGPCVAHVWIKDFPHACPGKFSRQACGIAFKSGINYFIYDCLFIDFFLDYIYLPIHKKDLSNLSGIKLGIGVGTAF